jgi:hypothetical protein
MGMRIASGIIAAAALVALPGIAVSQDRDGPSPLVEALSKCLAIVGDAERLACHDAAARRLVDASRRREVVVVDKEEVKKTRRSLFGFSLPRIGLFGNKGPDSGEEIDEVEVAIKSAAPARNGYMSFTLEDGARWTTTEPWMSRGPKAGEKLTIKKAAFGGYFVKLSGTRAVRAMRTG